MQVSEFTYHCTNKMFVLTIIKCFKVVAIDICGIFLFDFVSQSTYYCD